ncbi:hypothetical protein HYFRA_00011331 [Hymenoscyphus fraxineus]|uniref:Gcp-like domain-containing protein n=1 Tax=Hymenoscyphus fraxineus TaxID=746836 RepID=A0A9N9L1I2_9HELO|nr:hypothetical protein HYFRA_00011331 [Hymenoscyphus fraxineus]
MRPACHLARRTLFQFAPRLRICAQRRCLLTLAIETSCDDTCVAILERHKNRSATLHFNSKITSDNRPYGGVYPIVAHESHQQNIAALVKRALSNLPAVSQSQADEEREERMVITDESGRSVRKKPDFVSVTRGPGARASLISGVDFAKGFAVALNIPLVAINHMQAHALTPRLVAALEKQNMENAETIPTDPPFPFLTLLVSGGHTMLVHSKDLCDHEIIANTTDIAIGDMLDKSARDVLPQILLDSAPCVMYGPLLENYAFPNNEEDGGERFSTHHAKEHSENTYGWKVNSPYARSGPRGISSNQESFSFSGIGSSAKRIADGNTNMDETERRLLAREIMRVSFEHLASRVLLALEKAEIKHNTVG